MTLDDAVLRRLPKVLLHEHLDGGLRPQTVIELAAECGHKGLPTSDPAELGELVSSRGEQGLRCPSISRGLSTPGEVMQRRAGIERVACEFIEGLHQDGVGDAEVRFAPCFTWSADSRPRRSPSGDRGLTRRETHLGALGLIMEDAVRKDRPMGGLGPLRKRGWRFTWGKNGFAKTRKFNTRAIYHRTGSLGRH